MKAPAFWWRAPPGFAAHALGPLGIIVGALTLWRMGRPARRRAGVPVFCVGNPTVGGAGKTPIALAIATILANEGARPVFLSRGYGGRLRGPLRVDPAVHTAADVGDEPLLLAQCRPAIVARDRAAGSALAEAHGDAIVMDDGFQNPAVHKDWSVLLLDGAVGVGNGRATPAGPLRAPLGPQAERAHCVLAVDAGEGLSPTLPSVDGTVRLRGRSAEPLAGRPVLAFAGIGRPDKFFATLRGLGAQIMAAHAFGDHAPMTDAQATALLASAEADGLLCVTTRKDFVRLKDTAAQARLRDAVRVVDVEAELPAQVAEAVLAIYRGMNAKAQRR